MYFWCTVVDWRGRGRGVVAFTGIARSTLDSSTILVLNKFSPTEEDSFVSAWQGGLVPCCKYRGRMKRLSDVITALNGHTPLTTPVKNCGLKHTYRLMIIRIIDSISPSFDSIWASSINIFIQHLQLIKKFLVVMEPQGSLPPQKACHWSPAWASSLHM